MLSTERIFIIGAGLTGKGIALDLALRGCRVRITDDNCDVLARASRQISGLFHSLQELNYPFLDGTRDQNPLSRIGIEEIAGRPPALI
ncbi:MAG TPA: FAD-dependent oxidoreductase [Acidobacteriota bacterium]|nr:FAD-dependent oxidoreductase [Acidobacteriota bacterium]